ncbi:MFS general substrate transporter [Cystobasidium minutum MCA 4210]|uniref:MFS general substrate transporter n=1 Tax=Cystobasidium minutum MCA 4210 TaxID=1397322 RepID=UPI0034CDB679|eukprot:jgi/Rhomi1/9263/CE9262_288
MAAAGAAAGAAARVMDAGGVNVESAPQAYRSEYTTPYELDNSTYNMPASNLDARLSKLHGSDTFHAGAPAADHVPATATDSSIDHGRTQTVAKWMVKNQKFLVCLWSIGASGWSDACLGALLPFIQDYYHIGYKKASILFLATCIGYFLATCSISYLSDKLGRGKVITLGAAIQVIGYAIMIAAPPFPVLPCGWIVVAFGAATQLAQTNSYVASLPNPHQALGSLHGAYGLGGAASPLVATLFVSAGIKFSYFFAVSLGFAAINVTILLCTFRLKRDAITEEEHELVERVAEDASRDATSTVENGGRLNTSTSGSPGKKTGQAGMKEVLQNKTVWVISFFLMLYCGAEVAIGGWIVTFLREDLGGTDAIGYAATGFWLGIAAGRVLLPHFSLLVGERRVVFLYILLAMGLEFAVWLSHNLYAAAICTAFVGFFIGPFFPNAITLSTKLLNKRLHMAAISVFACLGSCGNALFPFCTGMLASVYGIFVLQPIVVGLLCGMMVLWAFLPRVERRSE